MKTLIILFRYTMQDAPKIGDPTRVLPFNRAIAHLVKTQDEVLLVKETQEEIVYSFINTVGEKAEKQMIAYIPYKYCAGVAIEGSFNKEFQKEFVEALIGKTESEIILMGCNTHNNKRYVSDHLRNDKKLRSELERLRTG